RCNVRADDRLQVLQTVAIHAAFAHDNLQLRDRGMISRGVPTFARRLAGARNANADRSAAFRPLSGSPERNSTCLARPRAAAHVPHCRTSRTELENAS